MSDKLWIYWVTTIPATVFSVVLWRYWLASSDAIIKSLKEWQKWGSTLLGRRKASRPVAPGKAGQP